MAKEGVKPESLYRAYPKKLIARIKLPSHLNQLRFLGAKVKDGSCVPFVFILAYHSHVEHRHLSQIYMTNAHFLQ